MRIDPAGWPFVIGGLVVAIVAAFVAGTVYGVVLLGLSVFFLFFFRDPERQVDAPADAVLSPADGRVMLTGPSTAQSYPASEWQQISGRDQFTTSFKFYGDFGTTARHMHGSIVGYSDTERFPMFA